MGPAYTNTRTAIQNRLLAPLNRSTCYPYPEGSSTYRQSLTAWFRMVYLQAGWKAGGLAAHASLISLGVHINGAAVPNNI